MPLLRPFGPRAFRLALPSPWAGDLGGRAALGRALLHLEGITDALVTESTALVVCAHAPESRAADALEAEIGALLAESAGATLLTTKTHLIDVVYDGPDLLEVASMLGIGADDLVERHTAAALDVSFLGFVPGFAYLRGLDASLASVPRRASPRARVPAFSVAIAGGMSAIYPAASPGGWNLLGRAVGFDPLETPLRVGDRIRFRAVPAAPHEVGTSDARVHSAIDRIEVVSVAGPALVIDARPVPRLHLGAPCGGPLSQSLADRARAAVGGSSDEALLERHGALSFVLGGTRPRRVADERGEAITLVPGDRYVLAPPREARVGYLAIEGGFDVPQVLGGRGTLLSVRRGGHEGRVLARGDQLALGSPRATLPWAAPPLERLARLAVARGPDLVQAGRDVIRVRVAYASDRTGTRLAPLEPHGLVAGPAHSVPMLPGAVQAPPSGELIVLGPDHPVTGGYPVVGFLDADACDALFARPLGSEVALCLTP